MENTDLSLIVEKGGTRFTIPHDGKRLTFIYPPFGLNHTFNNAVAIERADLAKPTFAELTSLLGAVLPPNDTNRLEILKLIESKWLFAYTGILYVPDKGAYIQDNPKIRGQEIFMEESDLIKKLDEKDPSVRYVPFGFKIGTMIPLELRENPFVIGLAGKYGARTLARVAEQHNRMPNLGSYSLVEQPVTAFSVLISFWDSNGELSIRCWPGDNRVGYTFGIEKKTRKAA